MTTFRQTKTHQSTNSVSNFTEGAKGNIFKNEKYSTDDQCSDRGRQLSKHIIPIIPKRAVPSNVRCKSSDVRNITVRNFIQDDETNAKDCEYSSRYNPIADRSRHLTTENQASRYSTKSVDHVKDYIEKKKIKEELFSLITGKSNIIELEKFIKNKNPDLNCRNDEWKTPIQVATEK